MEGYCGEGVSVRKVGSISSIRKEGDVIEKAVNKIIIFLGAKCRSEICFIYAKYPVYASSGTRTHTQILKTLDLSIIFYRMSYFVSYF